MGLLSTTGMVVSEDSFGPVSDNAAGIAEMAGEFGGEAERIMVSLDAVGNTTKAITKGVAIASAVIATVALFASFIETIGNQLNLEGHGQRAVPQSRLTQINVANPTTFIGLLIGGSIAFLFSRLAIRAVGRSAGTVVEEVRRQFREHPGIMDYTEKPEYGHVISICTAAAQRELATPALLAVLSPVIVGFGINYFALGAFLGGTILTGQLMANFLSNSGGAWDNAKKYIEDGHYGGKGSEAHKAAVIGDTVGDPFKDTAGPALNPLIKVMNLVSLLILPAVITSAAPRRRPLRDRRRLARDPARPRSLFSKRSAGMFADEESAPGVAAERPEAARTREPRPRSTMPPSAPSPVRNGEDRRPTANTGTRAHGQAARHRRVAGQGEDHRGLPRRRLRRRVVDRPHPRPAALGRRGPAAYKGEPWARLGVDVDNDFKPLYVVSEREAGAGAPSSVASWATRARSTSRPTRTARASRSPGTSPRCSRPGCR